MSPRTLNYDKTYLRQLYQDEQATLLEMAAPSYLHSNAMIQWIVRRRMEIVLGFLDLAPGRNLLDFGCGAGILFLQLEPRPGSFYGVDLEIWPAEKMLAHHHREDVKLFKGEDWLLTIADGSLDNIVALEVLEHVDDLPGLLESFKRKLTSNGRLIVSGPTENAIYQVARKISGFSGHYHVRNIFDIRQALAAAGFVEARRKTLPLPGLFALFLVSEYHKGI